MILHSTPSEIGPQHPLSYRREVVAPLFEVIAARDSCAIVGSSSMGKSRLLHFISRPDVQQHYLGDAVASALLVLADGNRLAELSEWGFYELLLTALTEACGGHSAAAPLRAELNALRREAITSHDPILARRHLELAVHMLCQEHGLTLCFILDEFDQLYRTLPPLALANLRALRDANKYRLCYVLVLREHPARLRAPAECEGFYELFSRAILGLGPYAAEDAERVVTQLEARKGRSLPSPARAQLLDLSGGHPGLIVALFDVLTVQGTDDGGDLLTWALDQPAIQEECRKLWEGLVDDERLGLSHIVQGLGVAEDVRQVLLLKGIIQTGYPAPALFSPLFAQFVLMHGAPLGRTLWVDEEARVVWLGTRPIKDLTAREFDLVAFLYHHVGLVRTRDQILARLYPYDSNNIGLEDGRVDTLVRRIREKIEPVRSRPRYLLTARGMGYRLVDTPDKEI